MLVLVYCLGFAVVIVGSIYMDVDHYKAYKSLPIDPHLLGGTILAIFWPFALMVLIVVLCGVWFGIVYDKVISLLANQD